MNEELKRQIFVVAEQVDRDCGQENGPGAEWLTEFSLRISDLVRRAEQPKCCGRCNGVDDICVADEQPKPEPRSMPIPKNMHEARTMHTALLALYPQLEQPKSCLHCGGSGEIEPDNNGKIGPCPVCKPAEQTKPEPVVVNGREVTHYCTICGALWILWPAGTVPGLDGRSWSLASKACGKCCDNEPMGDQIKPLYTASPAPPTKPEPVAWANVKQNGDHEYHGLRELPKGRHFLYTAPPAIPESKPEPVAFEQAWSQKEAEGYSYGRDALEQVRFGWELREQFATSPEIPENVIHTIGDLLANAMNAAVADGADSRSMPDDYVELAQWIAAAKVQQP